MMTPRPRLLQRILPFWETTSVPEALFALVVLIAPLAIGGVHPITRIALSGVALSAFAWTAWRVRRHSARMRLGVFGVALMIAIVWAFVQWLPLPTTVVQALSLHSAQARRLAAEALGVAPPTWQPLTLDAGHTALAVTSLVGFAAVFLTALNLRTDAAVRERLIVYVEVAAVAVMAIGLLHRLVGFDTIYGVYHASVSLADRPLITPFVNPNHAGALMMMGALVATGRWLTADQQGRYHIFVAAALSMGVVATLSRANNALLVIGLLIIGANLTLRRRGAAHARARFFRLAVGFVALIFLAVVFVGPQRWLGEIAGLSDLDTGDMGLVRLCWASGGALISGYLWLGTGAGAFAVAAPSVMPDWDAGLIAYAHNGVLQVVAELGLPVAVLVFGLVIAGVIALLRSSWAHPERFALVVALLLVVAQNMVDFSLWLPGVALPFAALLGVAVGEAWPSRGRARLAWRWPFAASLAVSGVLAVSALYAWEERPDAWRSEMRAELEAGKPARVDLAEILERHPHDFYAFRLATAVATQRGDRGLSERLLARTGELAPTEPDTLAARAEAALRDGDVEGGIELLDRLATEYRWALRRATKIVLAHRDNAALLAAWFDPRARFGASKGTKLGAKRVAHAAEALGRARETLAAEKLLRWGLDRFPDALPLYELLGSRWTNETTRAADLDRLSVTLLARAGEAPAKERDAWARAGYLLQGHVRLHSGAPLDAWHLYTEAATLAPERAAKPLIAAGRAALKLGRLDLLDDVLNRLADTELRGAWQRGQYCWLLSREREARGDIRGAIRQMQRALRDLGFVAPYHERLARLFELVGDSTSAERSRHRATELRAEARTQRTLNLR